jgi:hypothetical protein
MKMRSFDPIKQGAFNPAGPDARGQTLQQDLFLSRRRLRRPTATACGVARMGRALLPTWRLEHGAPTRGRASTVEGPRESPTRAGSKESAVTDQTAVRDTLIVVLRVEELKRLAPIH